MTIMTNLERITIFFYGIFLFHSFFMKVRKNLRSFSNIYLLDNRRNLTDSCIFGGPVGSLMLRDSDYVCDGEYGNSENVSLL